MSKPVLVLIMSKTCGACIGFKRDKWGDLKNYLIKRNDVDIVEITVDPPSTTLEQYHPDLAKYVGWYPTILLFSGSNWSNKSSSLKGFVKNGKLEGDKVTNVPFEVNGMKKQIDYSPDSIGKWIDNNINNLDTETTKNNTKNNSKKMYVPTYGSVKNKYRSERFDEY